jgi:Ca2+-binding EF-hand superfamily protein
MFGTVLAEGDRGVKRAMPVIAMTIALAWLASAPAAASSAGEALKRFGLVGAWSQNCAVPSGTLGASRMTFAVPDGGAATFTSTMTIPIPGTPQASTVFEIADATVLSDRQIKLVGKTTKLTRSDAQKIASPDASQRQIIIERVNAQIRFFDNRLVDGTSVATEGGVVRATGRPTPFLNKCEDAAPAAQTPPHVMAQSNPPAMSAPPAPMPAVIPGQQVSATDYLLSRLNPNMTREAYLNRMRSEFRMADADANGEISEADGVLLAQIAAASFRTMYFVQLFQADLDGDGVVTEDELRRWLTYGHHSTGAQPAAGKTVEQTIEDQIRQIMVADYDHDGRITFAEALRYANSLPNMGELRQVAVRQLLALAPPRKPTLSLADLEAAAEKLFQAVDANGDGVVSADELRAYRADHSRNGAR